MLRYDEVIVDDFAIQAFNTLEDLELEVRERQQLQEEKAKKLILAKTKTNSHTNNHHKNHNKNHNNHDNQTSISIRQHNSNSNSNDSTSTTNNNNKLTGTNVSNTHPANDGGDDNTPTTTTTIAKRKSKHHKSSSTADRKKFKEFITTTNFQSPTKPQATSHNNGNNITTTTSSTTSTNSNNNSNHNQLNNIIKKEANDHNSNTQNISSNSNDINNQQSNSINNNDIDNHNINVRNDNNKNHQSQLPQPPQQPSGLGHHNHPTLQQATHPSKQFSHLPTPHAQWPELPPDLQHLHSQHLDQGPPQQQPHHISPHINNITSPSAYQQHQQQQHQYHHSNSNASAQHHLLNQGPTGSSATNHISHGHPLGPLPHHPHYSMSTYPNPKQQQHSQIPQPPPAGHGPLPRDTHSQPSSKPNPSLYNLPHDPYTYHHLMNQHLASQQHGPPMFPPGLAPTLIDYQSPRPPMPPYQHCAPSIYIRDTIRRETIIPPPSMGLPSMLDPHQTSSSAAAAAAVAAAAAASKFGHSSVIHSSTSITSPYPSNPAAAAAAAAAAASHHQNPMSIFANHYNHPHSQPPSLPPIPLSANSSSLVAVDQQAHQWHQRHQHHSSMYYPGVFPGAEKSFMEFARSYSSGASNPHSATSAYPSLMAGSGYPGPPALGPPPSSNTNSGSSNTSGPGSVGSAASAAVAAASAASASNPYAGLHGRWPPRGPGGSSFEAAAVERYNSLYQSAAGSHLPDRPYPSYGGPSFPASLFSFEELKRATLERMI